MSELQFGQLRGMLRRTIATVEPRGRVPV